MTKSELEQIVDEVIDELPANVCEALEGVTVYAIAGRADPELSEAIRNAGRYRLRLAPGFRGVWVPAVEDLEDEDDDGAVEAPPLEPGAAAEGSIILNAEAFEDEEDARGAVLHEIGHALGMSEADVEDLGLG